MDEIEINNLAAGLCEAFTDSLIPIDPFIDAFNKIQESTKTLKKASLMLSEMERLIKAYALKPRKTTYKTIRRDCAKRNGRR